MRVENCSQLSFGNIRNTMGDAAGMALLERVGKGGKNIARFRALCDEQEANPVGVKFFFKNKENPRRARLRAEVSVSTPYFTGLKRYRQGIFTKPMKFFEKMCKKADKMNEELGFAKERYDMFLKKHSLGCGKNSSINALEE